MHSRTGFGADLPAGPPDPLLDEKLDFGRVDGQSEDQHAGGDGPVVVSDPPSPNAAAIHLLQTQLPLGPAISQVSQCCSCSLKSIDLHIKLICLGVEGHVLRKFQFTLENATCKTRF